MNIYPIQQSIVSRLQTDFTAAGTPFSALDLPETSKGYDLALQAPIVYVVYSGSQASASTTTNTIVQPRKLTFNCEIHSRKLYNADGLFAVRDILEQSLIGFKPLNCQRLYLVKDDITQTEDTSLWIHVFQFECETVLVQKDESDPIIVPSFQELVFNE